MVVLGVRTPDLSSPVLERVLTLPGVLLFCTNHKNICQQNVPYMVCWRVFKQPKKLCHVKSHFSEITISTLQCNWGTNNRVAKFESKVGSRRTTKIGNLVVLNIFLVVLILIPYDMRFVLSS